MKCITTTIFVLAMLMTMIQGYANAQLTGTKTIPGTYASVKLAIDDLNANGVGTGGVTFNIAPGYTETIPMGGLIIDITTNRPTSGSPVVFQRSGAGTNPLIRTDTNGSGVISNTIIGGRKDAILCLVGTDYITINNIDFDERYTGGSQTLKTEYGIEMVRKDSTDGCKHISITGWYDSDAAVRYTIFLYHINKCKPGGKYHKPNNYRGKTRKHLCAGLYIK